MDDSIAYPSHVGGREEQAHFALDLMRLMSAESSSLSVLVQEAATAARRRAAGLAADALFAAEEGGDEEQPSPADADAGDEDEAERQYRLELGRELQARALFQPCSSCNLHTPVLCPLASQELSIAAAQSQLTCMQHDR